MITVGHALAAAMRRAQRHESFGLSSGRPVKVQIGLSIEPDPRFNGLMIIASTPARTADEARLLQLNGWRCVPWSELDARARDLPRLVDEVVCDLERLFGERRDS